MLYGYLDILDYTVLRATGLRDYGTTVYTGSRLIFNILISFLYFIYVTRGAARGTVK